MPLVRLQCPACASIVKISEQIASQHPLVRCAKCQGLVTVATSRVIEPAAASDDGDDYSYKPKKKRRKSSGSTVPVGMIVGIVVGLLVLVGAGIGVYFLINHFGGSPLDKSFKRVLANLERMADAAESIKTPQDVPKAFDQMKTAITDMKEMEEENKNSGIRPDTEEAKKISEKYLPEVMKLGTRIQSALMMLSLKPELAQALKDNASRLGGGFDQLARLGAGMNFGGQPNFGTNPPPNDPPVQPPPTNSSQQQLENSLISKSLQAKLLPAILEEVRDSESADLALMKMDAILQVLNSYDRTIKQLERHGSRTTTSAAQKSLQDIEKTKEELAVHLNRIEKLPDLGSVHTKIVRKLSEAGLASSTTTTASNPPGKESSNPFEPAASGSTGGSSSKPDSGNPFEPAAKPGKTAPSTGMSDSLDAMITKLTSNDHFKKLEGLKEAQSAKVEEAGKAAVLEALLKLCGDSDVHQKVEVLKAYKKWATTQEEKERLGEHADVLLKEHWAKKDALRYFGENKIISASKEVAYLLKDTFDRKDAAETLIAMGSDAEKSVIPHLTDLEPQVRQMAIEVLARIGTPACIPDLQKLKTDRFVGRAASQAITLINSRKK